MLLGSHEKGSNLSAEDVSAALARITGSEAFRRSPKMSSFLTMVVQRTLDGRGAEIKGYTIAVDALGRSADFDPQVDPIVRVEAQRLRRALDRYYTTDGAADPVEIRIPNGGYIPLFTWRDVAIADLASDAPVPALAQVALAQVAPAQVAPAQIDSAVLGSAQVDTAMAGMTRQASTAPRIGLFPDWVSPDWASSAAAPVSPALAEAAIAASSGAGKTKPPVAARPVVSLKPAYLLAALVAVAAVIALVWMISGPAGGDLPRNATATISKSAPVTPVTPVTPGPAATSPTNLVSASQAATISINGDWVRMMRARALAGSAPSAEFRMPLVITPKPGDEPSTAKAVQDYARFINSAILRFSDLIFISTPELAQAMSEKPRYQLEFSALRRLDQIEGFIQLTHRPTGDGIWSSSLVLPEAQATDEARIADLARRTATRLGQLYGLIHADLRKRAGDPALRCVITASDYFANATLVAHRQALDCLADALEKHPSAGILWAHLSLVLLDEYRVGFNRAGDDVLDRIGIAARTAVELSPNSPRAQQAKYISQFIRGETEKAIITARRAYELNPYDTDVMADLGARLIQVGRYDEGVTLLHAAIDVNPAYPPWIDELLWLAARMTGDRVEMSDRAIAMARDEGTLALVIRAADAGARGQLGEGMALLRRLFAAAPEFGPNPRAFVERRQFAPEIVDALMSDLASAGLGTLVKP
jgi:tetratricopeptide (TPR) repeat protein